MAEGQDRGPAPAIGVAANRRVPGVSTGRAERGRCRQASRPFPVVTADERWEIRGPSCVWRHGPRLARFLWLPMVPLGRGDIRGATTWGRPYSSSLFIPVWHWCGSAFPFSARRSSRKRDLHSPDTALGLGQASRACRVVRPSHACSMSRLPSLYPGRTGKRGSSRPRAVGLGREVSQSSRPAGWERLSSVRRCPLAGPLDRPHRRYPRCGRDVIRARIL